MEMKEVRMVHLSAACVGFVINVCAFAILFRIKHLRKNRFPSLILYLSISDIVKTVHVIFISIIKIFSIGDHLIYICKFISIMAPSATIFSMYQVLLICIERLNATYNVPVVHLKRLTSDRAVVFGFAFIHCLALGLWIHVITTMSKRTCALVFTVTQLIILDVPLLILITATVGLYVVILIRIHQHNKKVHVLIKQGQTGVQATANRIVRMKRNMITLGIIVGVTTLIVAPRPIASVAAFTTNPYEPGSYTNSTASYSTDSLDSNVSFYMIATFILILNPLLDPFIYVLRIQAFRQRLLNCVASKNRKIAKRSTFATSDELTQSRMAKCSTITKSGILEQSSIQNRCSILFKEQVEPNGTCISNV